MRRKLFAITLVELLVVIGILGVIVALLLPAKRSAREAARRNACLSNLKQIALALENYKEAKGTYPPAYTVDEEGNRLHSWRTLILPYMEHKLLYEKIDLTKPWDHPANAEAMETVCEVFLCPSYPGEELETTYHAVIGEDCVFSGSDGRDPAEIIDEKSSTIMIVEVGSERAVHWMSPEDITAADFLKLGPEMNEIHPGIFQVVLADGHVDSITRDIDWDVVRGMLTIAGGEQPEW